MTYYIKLTDFVKTGLRSEVEKYHYCVPVEETEGSMETVKALIKQFNKNPDLRMEGVVQEQELAKKWEDSCLCFWHQARK